MHVHALICFSARSATGHGDGNPALVIEGAPLDTAARQAFARERNTTCVFLDQDGDGAGDDGILRVDYFYPHMRSPLCLHATLAVAALLFARPGAPASIAVTTALKGQRLVLSQDGDAYFVRLAAQPVPALAVAPSLAAALLNMPGAALPSAPRLASVGSPKLLVEVANTEALYALQPDLPAIATWGQANGVNGIYAWCRRADGGYEGRNFNHLDPALEDSATGVAAGALSVALGHGLVLRQGRASGRDCLIRTRFEDTTDDKVEGSALLVGGAARMA
jgi:PhzF family phenazine biosynthesis protein